jgi:NitT/TauT family transport system permease protein
VTTQTREPALSHGATEAEVAVRQSFSHGAGGGRKRWVRGWQQVARLTALRLLVLVVFVGAWQAISGRLVDSFWISTPPQVVAEIVTAFRGPDLWRAVNYTLFESLAGLAIGGVLGILAGLLLGANKTVDQVLAPYTTVLNTIPRFALAPLFIVYFGIGAESKVVLVVTMVFFVLLVNTYSGYHSVDKDFLALLNVLGATRRQVYMKLYWPTIVPWIFAGLHLALAYALASAVVGEMIAAQYGLGVLIARASGLFNIAGVFALLAVLAAISVVLDLAIAFVERRLLAWRFAAETSE